MTMQARDLRTTHRVDLGSAASGIRTRTLPSVAAQQE
jgi:hypothetical protein